MRDNLSHTTAFPFAVVTPVPTEREFTEQMDSTYLSMRDGNATEHELIET